MKKLTTAEFIERARKVHGDRYDYSRVDYVNYKSKVAIICPMHGEFEQTPSNHFAGDGCPECGKGLKGINSRSNTESFVRKAKAMHGDAYDYSMVEYIDKGTRVTIICPVHGSFLQAPSNHLSGGSCRRCGGKPLTTPEFIKRAKKVHGKKYDYSKVDYLNASTPVIIICPKHGEFKQTPARHLSKSGCQTCAGRPKVDTASFIAKARKIHEEQYDYSRVEYKNNRTKVIIVCPEHGEFKQTPSSHLMGNGCGKCSGNYAPTTEEFIQRAKKVHGDRYDYTNAVYRGAKECIQIRCSKHGMFEQTPDDHLAKKGCPSCAGNKRLTTSEFISRAKLVHNNKYSYDKTIYKNQSGKVIITCSEHGDFVQRAGNHLMGKGCPKCKAETLSKFRTKTTEQFSNAAREIFDGKYDYSKVLYKGKDDKVIITCPEHGDFLKSPHNHLRGQGCPSCAYSGTNLYTSGVLYYIRVETRTRTYWKIGITKHDVNKRFWSDVGKIKILKTWEYNLLADAYYREQELLKEYDSDLYKGDDEPLTSGGNTELFTRDVLGLDPEYNQAS